MRQFQGRDITAGDLICVHLPSLADIDVTKTDVATTHGSDTPTFLCLPPSLGEAPGSRAGTDSMHHTTPQLHPAVSMHSSTPYTVALAAPRAPAAPEDPAEFCVAFLSQPCCCDESSSAAAGADAQRADAG